MSGGSFNYLCHSWCLEDLIPKIGELSRMIDALTEFGATDAAKETEALRLDIAAFDVRVSAKLKRLQDVWRAIEWLHSCDWGPEQVEEELRKYRGEPLEAPEKK